MADKVRITPYIDREVFDQIDRIHRERRKTNKMMRLSTVVNEALGLFIQRERDYKIATGADFSFFGGPGVTGLNDASTYIESQRYSEQNQIRTADGFFEMVYCKECKRKTYKEIDVTETDYYKELMESIGGNPQGEETKKIEEDSDDTETLEEFLLKSSGVSEELCGPSNNNSDSNRIDNDEIQQFTTPEWERAVKNIYEEVRHDSRHRDKYIEVVEFIKNYNPEKE